MRRKQYAQELNSRLKWTAGIRPMAIGAFLADTLAPERRAIITTKSGLRFYVDPLGNLGESLIHCGEYEPVTEAMFRKLLHPGDSFLDIGANEGYFTTLATSIVGDAGYVVAVEPQGKLCDIIDINVSLNGGKAAIVHGAIGGVSGRACELFLYPSLNNGASSIVRRPKFYRQVETAPFLDPSALLADRASFDLVKVDVEGFEGNVIRSLQPLLSAGKIKTLILDYHASILRASGVDPSDIEAVITRSMTLSGHHAEYDGYRIYKKG